MTFSEKLKEARKNSGLSQEQLAEKLCVSRQAVTKWETGRGLPDVENIKAISLLLNVSIDYLLSDEECDVREMREKIDLDKFTAGNGARSPKDACCSDKYPSAEHIYALIRKKKKSGVEWITDFIIGAGALDVFDSLANYGQTYYLVEAEGKQFFVCVDDEFITSSALSSKYEGKSFQRGKYIYKKLYDIKAYHGKSR